MVVFWGFFSFINSDTMAGLITMATNRLEARVMIRVNGMYPMNSPMIPGQKSIGEKAAKVVKVDPMTGYATSEVAFMAASTREAPCSIKR